ncbi:MAG: DoxX family membrane protein [Candidatus Nealsonbacteria bacterium]|nr:DoxX family membrane protein [Candidatus Nealsonbacteria bacterium]
MSRISFHVLRIGAAITFLWIGILILSDPQGWTGFIRPWAADILPISLLKLMTSVAFFDIFAGIFLLVNYYTWLAALLGSFHLALVLIVSGVNAITVRDIGLLTGTVAIFISSAEKSKILSRLIKV